MNCHRYIIKRCLKTCFLSASQFGTAPVWRKLFILAPKPACCLYIYILYIHVSITLGLKVFFCDKLVQCTELGICRFGTKFREHTRITC